MSHAVEAWRIYDRALEEYLSPFVPFNVTRTRSDNKEVLLTACFELTVVVEEGNRILVTERILFRNNVCIFQDFIHVKYKWIFGTHMLMVFKCISILSAFEYVRRLDRAYTWNFWPENDSIYVRIANEQFLSTKLLCIIDVSRSKTLLGHIVYYERFRWSPSVHKPLFARAIAVKDTYGLVDFIRTQLANPLMLLLCPIQFKTHEQCAVLMKGI